MGNQFFEVYRDDEFEFGKCALAVLNQSYKRRRKREKEKARKQRRRDEKKFCDELRECRRRAQSDRDKALHAQRMAAAQVGAS